MGRVPHGVASDKAVTRSANGELNRLRDAFACLAWLPSSLGSFLLSPGVVVGDPILENSGSLVQVLRVKVMIQPKRLRDAFACFELLPSPLAFLLSPGVAFLLSPVGDLGKFW